MGKLVFREWLEDREALDKWIRARLERDRNPDTSRMHGMDMNLSDKSPGSYISLSFYWAASREGKKFWSGLAEEWGDAFVASGRKAVPGMPLDDDLALAFMLAELEAGDGNENGGV